MSNLTKVECGDILVYVHFVSGRLRAIAKVTAEKILKNGDILVKDAPNNVCRIFPGTGIPYDGPGRVQSLEDVNYDELEARLAA